PPKLRRTKTH
ncbi:hypothetical protein AB1N83_007096, partial [Pleurotus pulmonarius]